MWGGVEEAGGPGGGEVVERGMNWPGRGKWDGGGGGKGTLGWSGVIRGGGGGLKRKTPGVGRMAMGAN